MAQELKPRCDAMIEWYSSSGDAPSENDLNFIHRCQVLGLWHLEERPVASSSDSSGNPVSDHLMARTPDEQASLLGQIAGDGCVGTRAFYMGQDKEHGAYWSVGCTNGLGYQVEIDPDAAGHTRVVDCSILKAIRVNCFEKLEGQ